MTIQAKWEEIQRKSPPESALILYTMAGFPTLERSLEMIQTLARCGADMIEVGFPFPIQWQMVLPFNGHQPRHWNRKLPFPKCFKAFEHCICLFRFF